MSERTTACFSARLNTAWRMSAKAAEGGAMNSVLLVP